jgi:hypothetical protein
MADVTGMFVPTYQGLSAADFVRPPAAVRPPCPFDVPGRIPFHQDLSPRHIDNVASQARDVLRKAA